MDISSKLMWICLHVLVMSCMNEVTTGVYASTPTFIIEPDNEVRVFQHGSSTTTTILLECEVENLNSDEKVSWLKNGNIISDGEQMRQDAGMVRLIDYRYRITTSEAEESDVFNLRINSVDISRSRFDIGRYQCAVLSKTNDNIIITSRTAVVTLYVTPRDTHPICRSWKGGDSDMNVTSVREGDTITISCESDLGEPPVVLQWTSNNNSMVTDARTGIRPNGLSYSEYTFPAVRNNTGIYTCNIHHPGYGDASPQPGATCTIGPFDIQYKPDNMTITPNVVTITDAKDIANFTCDANGNPSIVEYAWIYNSNPSISNLTFIGYEEGNILQLHGFKDIDNANYTITCVAQNTLGECSTSSVLIVNISSKPANIENKRTAFELTPTYAFMIGGLAFLLGSVLLIAVVIIIFKRRRRRNCKGDEKQAKQDNGGIDQEVQTATTSLEGDYISDIDLTEVIEKNIDMKGIYQELEVFRRQTPSPCSSVCYQNVGKGLAQDPSPSRLVSLV